MVDFREAERRSAGDARRVAQRWLRAVFLEDWGLKLLALGIALGLWFGVTGQRAPATVRVRGVQLDFLLPSDMEIGNDPLDEVDITLRGSKPDLDAIVVRDLVARADVSNVRPGERVLRLSPDKISIDLPSGVSIERIEPNTVPLRLERRVEREIDVEARIEGNLPEGYELRSAQVTPRRVRVRGPESHVDALEKAQTETITLDGQSESFTVAQAAIDILDRKVIPLEPVVTVRLEIGEERVEKRFTNVEVRAANGVENPRTASVSVLLLGARSVLDKLRSEDLAIVLEQTEDATIKPRLALPPGTAGNVELLSTTPSEFSIR